MMEIHFDINHPGEIGAGIRGYTEHVTVNVEHDPGGEDGEFFEFMAQCLAEWFDGASVRAYYGKEKPEMHGKSG
jgi:hypothetical protein